MTEIVGRPEAAAEEPLEPAKDVEDVESDGSGEEPDVTLPDPSLTLDAAEARDLLRAFRRIRDAHSGQYAAPVTELPDDPVRVATAIVAGLDAATSEERRHLLEDLVDLQAFVDDPPVGLRPPADGTGPNAVTDPLLERIRWRQATLTAFELGHPSVIGDHNAIRDRWTPIGDARAAINLINTDREQQAAGIGAMLTYPVAALIGDGAAVLIGNARPSLVGIGILGLGWLAAPFVGAGAGHFEAWLGRSRWRRSRVTPMVELAVGGIAIFVAPAIFGAVVAVVVSRLGGP